MSVCRPACSSSRWGHSSDHPPTGPRLVTAGKTQVCLITLVVAQFICGKKSLVMLLITPELFLLRLVKMSAKYEVCCLTNTDVPSVGYSAQLHYVIKHTCSWSTLCHLAGASAINFGALINNLTEVLLLMILPVLLCVLFAALHVYLWAMSWPTVTASFYLTGYVQYWKWY